MQAINQFFLKGTQPDATGAPSLRPVDAPTSAARTWQRRLRATLGLVVLLVAGTAFAAEEVGIDREYTTHPPAPTYQTAAQAAAKSEGCQSCHTDVDQKSMHRNPAVVLGCTDCHGGNAEVVSPNPGKH